MIYDYWQVEIRRLIAAVVLALIVGYATGYWLLSFLLVSSSYIAWILFKLRQLQKWLVAGQPPESMPDSDGAWEQITYLIHRSKQKSKSRKKKQRETLDRLNNVMAALPDATILINQDFIIQWSNPAAARLLGIQTEADWGNRLDNLIRSPELYALLRAGDAEQEIRLNSPMDDNIILQAHLVPVQKNLYLFNVRDISQGVHLQQTRKAFFANASHELRTPLTVLAGYLELFEDDSELPEHLIPAVQQARAQADRMQRIISDMLSLSKLENDEQRRVVQTEINVPELLEDVSVSLNDTLAADSHTLSLNVDPSLYLLGHEPDLL
ncbi:MAG TPA: phosphate regulon sensor protein PhoR, partial [Thiolinea sp.]|nr:phosphate regulon sensor protein PhoR [Thiolinea sp.]